MSERGPEEELDPTDELEDTQTEPPNPGAPSNQAPSSGQKRPVILIITLLVLAVIVAAGVVFYLLFTERVSHTLEETAEFLPAETSLYFSLNT